jgi:hypothetical protein
MRPRGEIRAALADAAQQIVDQQVSEGEVKGVTWRQLARAACVGFEFARATVKNMVTAGELVPVGEEREPGSRRPLVTYAPASIAQGLSSGGVAA